MNKTRAPLRMPIPSIIRVMHEAVVRLEVLGDDTSAAKLMEAASALEANWIAQWENRQ